MLFINSALNLAEYNTNKKMKKNSTRTGRRAGGGKLSLLYFMNFFFIGKLCFANDAFFLTFYFYLTRSRLYEYNIYFPSEITKAASRYKISIRNINSGAWLWTGKWD